MKNMANRLNYIALKKCSEVNVLFRMAFRSHKIALCTGSSFPRLTQTFCFLSLDTSWRFPCFAQAGVSPDIFPT